MLRLLKNGFAAIIAILAISATIAAQGNVFNAKKVAVADGCYRQATVLYQGGQVTLNAANNLPCQDFPQLGSPLVSSSSASILVPTPTPAGNCIIPTTPICCFVIEDDVVIDYVCGTYRAIIP